MANVVIFYIKAKINFICKIKDNINKLYNAKKFKVLCFHIFSDHIVKICKDNY